MSGQRLLTHAVSEQAPGGHYYLFHQLNSSVLGSPIREDLGHFIVDQSVAPDKLSTVVGKAASFEVRHATAGFYDDQGPCRHIPGLLFQFPESIESARCDIADI